MTEPYWEQVHAAKDVDDVSWWQPHDAVWVDLVESTGVPTSARIADVGSGSSTLVDALLSRGFRDITLLDVSATALQRAVDRVRNDAGYWQQLEGYISAHTEARFTHGLCQDCKQEHFPPDFEHAPPRTV